MVSSGFCVRSLASCFALSASRRINCFGSGGLAICEEFWALQGNDNFSWTHGKHSFRFGGELRRDRYNQLGGANDRGAFYDGGYDTSNPASPHKQPMDGLGILPAGRPQSSAGRRQSVVRADARHLRRSLHRRHLACQPHGDPQPGTALGGRAAVAGQERPRGQRADPVSPGYQRWIGNIANMALHPVLVRTGSGDFYDGTGINYPGVQVARDGRMGDALVPNDP